MTAPALQYSQSTRRGVALSLRAAVESTPQESSLIGVSRVATQLDKIRRLVAGAQHSGTFGLTQDTQPTYDWLAEVYSYSADGRNDDAIDLLFDHIDDLLLAGDFVAVNELVYAIDAKRLNTTTMLAALSITKAAADKLPNRASLLSRIEAILRETEPDRFQRLLSGLR